MNQSNVKNAIEPTGVDGVDGIHDAEVDGCDVGPAQVPDVAKFNGK